MSTEEALGLETTDTADDEPTFTTHIEPADQGREEYARCTGCSREILVSIGFDQLTHPDDCPNAGR